MKYSPQVQDFLHRPDGYLAKHKEESLLATLLRWCEDPLHPRNDEGKFCPNPILVLIAVLFILSALTFVGFSLVQQ
jgi:hypothetical protein